MIAGFVQLMEMVIERLSVTLYYSLGIFLPLITVNCAILGTSLFMVNKVAENFTGLHALVYGFGSGLGWMLAIILMAGIRQKLSKARVQIFLEQGLHYSVCVTLIKKKRQSSHCTYLNLVLRLLPRVVQPRDLRQQALILPS